MGIPLHIGPGVIGKGHTGDGFKFHAYRFDNGVRTERERLTCKRFSQFFPKIRIAPQAPPLRSFFKNG